MIPFSTRAPKLTQQNMTIEVWYLTKRPKCESNLHLEVTYRCIKGVIDIISDVSSKSPVIEAISEHVWEGWRGMAKAVDEESLIYVWNNGNTNSTLHMPELDGWHVCLCGQSICIWGNSRKLDKLIMAPNTQRRKGFDRKLVDLGPWIAQLRCLSFHRYIF